jgi:CO/xanthine dehydrogenase Mo-binding subunit
MHSDTLLHPYEATNAYKHYKFRRGDMAAGWTAADVVVEGTYHLPYQEHAYLQPEAGLGYIDAAGRITVEIAGQWVHEDQAQIAHALDIPVDQVRVIYPAIGGAFGGREDMSLQIVLALAAWRLHQQGINRPVRITWSREESIIGHHKRHPGTIKARLGAKRDGTLTAVEADVILDAGAYNYTSNKVLGNAHLTVAGPYNIPHAHIDSYAVYTNNPPGGAFRGFGGPQGVFVAESQMNKLAVALGMDPVALRQKNVLREGVPSLTQTPLPAGISLPTVIAACADAAGWDQPLAEPSDAHFSPFQTLPTRPEALRRGRGFACAFKNVGFSFGFPERCEATIELHGAAEIKEVVLYHAGADVGQGAHTALCQMAAEAVGVAVEQVRLVASDTATSGDSGSASASRMTFMAGNAIRGAAKAALLAWIDEDRPARGHFRYTPPPTTIFDEETGASNPNFSYGYVAEVVELVVDTDTGHIHIERVVCANDVGRVINRQLIEGQVEGAVIQAGGYALSENLQVQDGHILNPRLSTYLIPGVGDIPGRVESVILEEADPLGPWGVRGMAEMPYLPLAPAITAALHDATGVWFDRLPLIPATIVDGLRP